MQLSTEVKNRVLYFHGGQKVFVTAEQEDNITRLSTTNQKTFSLNGHLTTFSSIARFGDIEDYFNDHPEERPEYRQEWKEQPIEPYQSLEDQALATERGRNDAIRGLELFIYEYERNGERAQNARWVLERYKQNKKSNLFKNI